MNVALIPAAGQSPDTAAPGTILSVDFDRRFTPRQINQLAPKHFKSIDPPDAKYAVDVFIITFASTHVDGEPAVIKAQLFVPRLKAEEVRPAYIFATGSTGLVDACRPSRAHIAGINWGEYRIHVMSYAGQGMIGLLPDYTGFGEPDRLQPYYVAEPEAMMLLDAIRAVNDFFDMPEYEEYYADPHPAAFLAGYSQGGHAIFAAADYRDEYAPEVEIGGVIGYGPARGVADLFREFTVSAPLVMYTYSWIYGEENFNPALMLQDRWLKTLEQDVTRLCIGAIQDYYPWVAAELYRPEFNSALFDGTLAEKYPKIAELMEENSTGLTGHGVSALILQGTDDVVVHPPTMNKFVNDLREKGSKVTYYVYEGSPHDTRAISFPRVVDWMEESIE